MVLEAASCRLQAASCALLLLPVGANTVDTCGAAQHRGRCEVRRTLPCALQQVRATLGLLTALCLSFRWIPSVWCDLTLLGRCLPLLQSNQQGALWKHHLPLLRPSNCTLLHIPSITHTLSNFNHHLVHPHHSSVQLMPCQWYIPLPTFVIRSPSRPARRAASVPLQERTEVG